MSTTVTRSQRPLNINADEFACDLNGSVNPATTATTQSTSDNSTKVATTAFVKAQGYATGTIPTFSTVGAAFRDLGDVSVVSYVRVNADETLSYLNAAQFLSAIGGTGNTGTVTSVGTGNIHTLSVSGTTAVTFTPNVGAVTDGGGNLATGDHIYDHVTSRISGLASTSYVDTAVSNLIDNAPANLNTLNELAEALNDDDDAIVTINTALSNRYTKTETDAFAVKLTGSQTIGGAKTFTSDITISDTYPKLLLTDTNHNDDWSITNNNGDFYIYNETDSKEFFRADEDSEAMQLGDGIGMTYDGISTSNSGTVVRGGFLNPAAEANMVHLPHLINDLAGFNKWSNGTITVSGLYGTRSGSSGSYSYSNAIGASNSGWANAFDSHSSTAGSWYSDNGTDGVYSHGTDTPGTIELQWTNEITYSLVVGIVFGSNSFTATYVKIEAYKGDGAGGNAWQTLCEITDNTDQVILRKVDNNSGTGSATTRLKYTLGGSVNGSYFRIHSLYMANYRAGDNNLNNTGTDTTRGVNFLERYKDGHLHGNLRPGADNTYDLGSSNYSWKNLYIDGNITIGGTYPRIFLTDSDNNDDYSVINNNGTFSVYNDTDSSHALTINGSNDATFAGTITSGAHTINSQSDSILTLNQTGTDTGWSYINFNTSGTRNWYIGQDNNKDFDIYNDNTDSLGLSINYINNTVSLGGNTIVSGELEATSLDINGNADISGALTLGTVLAAAEGGTGLSSISTLLNSNVTLSSLGAAAASHNHDDRYYTETESDAKFTSTNGTENDYTFKINDESNFSGNKWYHLATIPNTNGGLHIRGFISNHVETYGSQKIDLAIAVREGGSGSSVEITGQLDVLHNATSGTDRAGIRVIKTADSSYDEHKVYVRTTRYSMVTLRLTEEGSVTFNTDQSSPLTSEPAAVGGIAAELDTSTTVEGNYVVDNSTIKEIYHEGHVPTYSEISGTPTIPSGNQIIDWTAENAGTIHTSNFADANTNYYLDGITKSGNTLTFSVNGTTNRTYTFGSNAFNSTTIPAAESYTQHENISAASSNLNNSGRTYIQDITLDSNGHVTGVATATETVTDTNTTYSTATSSALGLVKIGYSENNKNYPVELSSGKMFVNVPWENTQTANTFRAVEVDSSGNGSADYTLGSTETLRFKKGSNVSMEEAGGVVTIAATNTTYSVGDGGLTQNNLTNTLKSNYDTAYTHSQASHAPSNATANSSDATLLARGNHTGTQAYSTLTGTPTTISATQATKLSNITVTQAVDLDSIEEVVATAVQNAGNETISGVKTFSSAAAFTSTTNSTSKTTGAVKLSGGMGIAKALNVGEDVVAYASSDERYKDNLQAITNPIDKVKSLTGYTFTWNDKHEQFNGNDDIGVVAQEVEKVFPEIVDTRDNGYKAVKYEKMVAVLIEAVKDQQKQIDELKEKLNGNS